MHLAGPIIGIILIVAFICLSIQAGFLLWGASIAKIENRTFGKALGTTLLGGIASAIVSFIMASAMGLVVGFLVSAAIMMPIFNTTFGKALGATILSWLLSILVFGVLAAIAAGAGLLALLF